MRICLSDLNELDKKEPQLFSLGCVVDTNALFAASVPIDRLNEWTEEVLAEVGALKIPIFSNINVRSEFLEMQRRVLVPEGLVSFYDQTNRETLNSHLKMQLVRLKSRKDKAGKEERIFKLGDKEIKAFRDLFRDEVGIEAWEYFCADFLHPYLVPAWEELVTEFKIHFLGTRNIEAGGYFETPPRWNDMVELMGKFGIGAADAMIVNFFMSSKFPLIVTGDEDVAFVVEKLSNGKKYVLVPDKISWN